LLNGSGAPKAVQLWMSLGIAVLLGAAGTACVDPGGEATRDSGRASETAAGSDPASSESSAAGDAADPVSDDVEYLHQLGQARGHLIAFTALHRLGAHDMAMTHARHPESELYRDLAPAFAARGKPGFAAELTALADAVEEGGNVDAAYAEVANAISENEPETDFVTRLMAIAALTRTAGEEFAIGVAQDGTVVNAHEYQDAYGFLTAAREMLTRTEAADAREARALALADEQLGFALAEFDQLTADRVEGDASVIQQAAARIGTEAEKSP
jgi:hypothetical protein